MGAARPTLADWVTLVGRAVSHRKAITACIFLVCAGASAAYYLSLEPKYRVEAKILAQRPQALPSAVRAVYEDVPTRSAWEVMHRRESLMALVRHAKLLPEDGADPAPGVPDRPPASGAAATSGDDPQDAILKALDQRLLVATEEGIITVSVDWPDAQQAYDIVQGAVGNFLEARHAQEITAIEEVISVLQGRATAFRIALDAAIEDARRRAARPASAPPAAPRGPSEELVRLQSVLEEKQRAVRDLENLRLRRVADLQAQLDQAMTTMSDAHPIVIGLRKDLEAAGLESPQAHALREDERKARKDFSDRLAREGFARTAAAFAAPTAPAPPAVTPPAVEDDAAVKQARTQYDLIAARLNAAQVELDAARAAFKYRYSVVWPPQRPTEPVSPDPWKILGAGLLASLLLALGAAVAPDLWSGRIVQRWQLERSLDLPILGEVHRRV